MSDHRDQMSIRQMLEYARQACQIAAPYRRPDLDTNLMLKYTLIYLITVLGEAARRVSQPTKNQYPQIPWSEIIGMRNRLVHGYDTIDLDLLWDTVQLELPPLIQSLEGIVGRQAG